MRLSTLSFFYLTDITYFIFAESVGLTAIFVTIFSAGKGLRYGALQAIFT